MQLVVQHSENDRVCDMDGQDGGMRNDPVPRAKVSDPLALSLSLADMAARSQLVIVDFLTRSPELGSVGDPAGIGRAFLDLTVKMMADPMSIAMAQLDLWADHDLKEAKALLDELAS